MKVWVAYYSDMSRTVLFGNELAAYKFAVKNSMEVIEAELSPDETAEGVTI